MSTPYTHEMHARACGEAARRGVVLSGKCVQVRRRNVTYCARIVEAVSLDQAGDCWTVEVFLPEKARMTVLVRNVLDCEGADMVLKPCAPCHVKLCTGLQDRCNLATCPAAHHTCMATVFAREYLDDGCGFPVPPAAQQYPLITPVHRFTIHARRTRSIAQALFVQQMTPLPVLDLDYPQIGIARTLAAQGGVHLGFVAFGQDHPCACACHQVK